MATPASQPRGARTERGERTRRRILDAAGQCFAGAGYAKTTVEEIAVRAGVSKALVYHHFRSKEEILAAVLERALSDWSEASRVEELAGSGSVLEALAGMHRSALGWARANPVLHALMTLDPMVLLTVGEATVRRQMDRFRRDVLRAVERGVQSGELRADLDVARVADVVRILHMAFVDHLLDPRWMGAPDDELVEASLDVLFHGIARREP